MKNFLSPNPIWQQSGIGLLRIIVGGFMIYHGWEVFDAATMKGYAGWDNFKNSSMGLLLVYLGKTAELLAGVMLLLGCFTRVACVVLIVTMLYISLFLGHGKIWYEDQYPFLFVLLGFVFIFSGPGKWSVDRLLFGESK
ncbi:MAG: DoxX family protein [Bacteroidetes bacterium]|nr:DoxX family protein [Bacteroidota bacterium]